MQYDLILRNGRIITPKGEITGDLAVAKGKIAKIGDVIVRPFDHAQGRQAHYDIKEIDCAGKFILPGAIDMHVHFRDPGFPQKADFGTESRAALEGGVTTVIDMPNTLPPALTLKVLEQKRLIAAQKSFVNYGFYMGLTADNLDEIKKAKNIAGVKIFMASSTGNMLMRDMEIIEKALLCGLFAIVHAEDEDIIQSNIKKYKKDDIDPRIHSFIRSHETAYKAIKAILHLAKKTEGRVHVTHVSTAQEVDEIRKFKSGRITCDAATHHLYLNTAYYEKMGNFAKVNPPLRDEEDRLALWEGIKDGIIDCVATDHAPHTKTEKSKPYWDAPSGMPGVQTLLPLLLDSVNHGEISLQDVVRLVSENPAKILRIKNKGRLEEGADADITVVDMDLKREITKSMLFYKCRWSPFEGRVLQGWPIMTVVNGKTMNEAHGQEVKFA